LSDVVVGGDGGRKKYFDSGNERTTNIFATAEKK
jgi:hypothetical protein